MSEMTLDECFAHPLWGSFTEWAFAHDIYRRQWRWADAEPAWRRHWECFLAGAEAENTRMLNAT